jgi:hypothetical protein
MPVDFPSFRLCPVRQRYHPRASHCWKWELVTQWSATRNRHHGLTLPLNYPRHNTKYPLGFCLVLYVLHKSSLITVSSRQSRVCAVTAILNGAGPSLVVRSSACHDRPDLGHLKQSRFIRHTYTLSSSSRVVITVYTWPRNSQYV